MSKRHPFLLSPRRFTSIRHRATNITTVGLTTGVIPQYRSASDSGAVIMAATTEVATTVVAVTDNESNPHLRRKFKASTAGAPGPSIISA